MPKAGLFMPFTRFLFLAIALRLWNADFFNLDKPQNGLPFDSKTRVHTAHAHNGKETKEYAPITPNTRDICRWLRKPARSLCTASQRFQGCGQPKFEHAGEAIVGPVSNRVAGQHVGSAF